MAGVSHSLNTDLAIDALGRLERAAANPAGGMHALGAHFVTSTQRNIEKETSPDGKKWPRLAPRTAAQRIGKGRRGFDRMLRVTPSKGLYYSINYQVLPDGVEWGSNLVYSRIHQLGGVINMPPRPGSVTLKKIRRKGGGVRSRFVRPGTKGSETKPVSIRGYQLRIPARPYLGISAADEAAVPEIIADYLRQEAGQ